MRRNQSPDAAARRTAGSRRRAGRLFAALLAAAVIAAPISANPVASTTTLSTHRTEQGSFSLVRLATGLVNPWAIAFLPDGTILVTERPGRLWRYDGRSMTAIAGLPDITASGQGGLLDLVLHPDYARNGWLYLTYSARSGLGLGTRVARARLSGNALSDVEVLFTINRTTAGGQHFGSRIVFGADGKLYVTVGDRGTPHRAQDLSDHAGSLLRLNDDGTVPSDNPFVGRSGAAAEIYSYGHRNAQGIALHPETGVIWLHEHGPQGGDEINIITGGANYGWPVITYGTNYGTGTRIGEGTEKPGMEQPVIHWTPSIAPSGMAFYTGAAFPGWQGNIFVGALAGQHLRRVVLDGDHVVHQESMLQRTVGRIRDVRQGPDGFLYLVTDAANGALYRLEPAR